MDSDKKGNDTSNLPDIANDVNSMVCQSEDIYRLRQDRYRLFVEDASVGCFETNLAGEFSYVNNAMCRLFGRTQAEIENHSFYDFMEPLDASWAARRFSQITDTEKIARLTWKILRENNTQHILKVSARPIIDSQGRRIGIRGMVRDITKKIRAQKTLVRSRKKIQQLYTTSREAEQRYRTFLKFLPMSLLVQNKDSSFAYLNPAFEKTFGWTREDLERNPQAHVPDSQIETRERSLAQLYQEGAFSGVETKRRTKDGRILDVIIDGSLFYDTDNLPAGRIVALRDVTKAKKDAQITQSLFQIAEALHHYKDLDSLLSFIGQQVQALLQVKHAHIILVDKKSNEVYFRAGVLSDSDSYHTFSQKRVPLNDTYLAGAVILSGEPRIINNLMENKARLIVPREDLTNLLIVPMILGDEVIGAVVGTNRVDRDFKNEDIVLLSSIAHLVSLPIENTRINDELRNSYEEISALNRAKDRIIDHLSHELRTPLSILSATLGMLEADKQNDAERTKRLLERCRRNLQRLNDMQAKIIDITREPNYNEQQTLYSLIERCTDQLETLADIETGKDLGRRMRQRIDQMFSLDHAKSERISLGPYIAAQLETLQAEFSHRQLDFSTDISENAGDIELPSEVLDKILKGLVRNSIEYTPDGGQVKVIVKAGLRGPELTVLDSGIGITRENQQLIFGNYFTTADVSSYGTGIPYNFDAGGSGFDLLRIRVFSERYNFKLVLRSERCLHIPTNADICPGKIADCSYCETPEHCHQTGGSSFTVEFSCAQDLDTNSIT